VASDNGGTPAAGRLRRIARVFTRRPRPGRSGRSTIFPRPGALALVGALAVAGLAAPTAHAQKPPRSGEWVLPPDVPAPRAPAGPIEGPGAGDAPGTEVRAVREGAVESAPTVGAVAPPPAARGDVLSGDADRWTEMGRFFEHAEPPTRDLTRARELYCRAAAAGHGDAMQRLGWMYLNGRGVARHEGMAGTMFRWAAELGNERASALAAAHPVASESAPPCLSAAGISTLSALKARVEAARAAARPAPAPVPVATLASIASPGATAQTLETLSPDRRRLVEAVEREARAALMDPRLVLAVIRAESNFDPMARSPRNALGLMQLIPETAQRFKVRDPFDPLENVRGGIAYLRWLLAYYRGDVQLALAAYNAGEGTVDKYRGVPPYAETIGYLQRIRAFYPLERHPFDLEVLGATPFRAGSPALR